jgi:drug/metabolite transporter (DMT)-like permease
MIVLILSAIILKERKRMVAGIILGLTGTAFILYGRSVGSATNASIGNMLVLINAISYGFI